MVIQQAHSASVLQVSIRCSFQCGGTFFLCLGNLSAPQIISSDVSPFDDYGCILNVEWSEAFVSCGGSVSQYVLSVTPPTSDCQSSPDCEVMDGSSSVYSRSGTETQYSLTVATQEYDITVRAEACAGSLTAESSVYTVNLKGDHNNFVM